MQLATTEQLVEDFRNHRKIVLVERAHSASVGMLVIPAQAAGPESVTFMARYCRGLVVLALTQERVLQLQLPAMSSENTAPFQQAFTTSIEAATGVTTGISAADRARTIQVAIDPACGSQDIITPGHIFPVAARSGGVLERAGFAEAAIDLVKMAGLNPSAALCSILDVKGETATLDYLLEFARRHECNLGSVQDLIDARYRAEKFIKRIESKQFTSNRGGDWKLVTYRNQVNRWEHFALVKGEPVEKTRILVHSLSLMNDVLEQKGSEAIRLGLAMDMLGARGEGIILLIREPGTLFPPNVSASEPDPFPVPLPGKYAVGAKILRDLGVFSVVLIDDAGAEAKVILADHGIEVVGVEQLAGTT